MSSPLDLRNLLVNYVEYNEYVFDQARLKVTAQLQPIPDDSNRTIVGRRYLIRVTGQIVPRKNIPRLDAADYQSSFNSVALNDDAFSVGATVDPEIDAIIHRLSVYGKPLRIVGQGVGNIYVNTIDPATGKFTPDIDFGPKPKLLSLKPLGLGKAWFIDWQVETSVMTCRGEKLDSNDIDFNNWENRIRSFVFTVQTGVNTSGYESRSIKGSLKIISPVFKSHTPDEHDPNTTRSTYGQADTLNTLPPALRGTAVISHITPPVPAGAPYPLEYPVEHSINNLQNVNTRHPDYPRYNPTNAPVRRYPRIQHKYLYETIDQWKEYVYNKFPLPYGYKRKSFDFNMEFDKAVATFVIVDEEAPPFSLVRNYIKVEGKQVTESKTEGLFRLFHSEISMTFHLPKYVYAPKYIPNAYVDPNLPTSDNEENISAVVRAYGRNTPRGRNVPRGFNRVTEPFKRMPGKLEAYLDFLRVVYQRFVLSLFNTKRDYDRYLTVHRGIATLRGNNPLGLTFISEANANEIIRRLEETFKIINLHGKNVKAGYVLPLNWRTEEQLAANDISFSLKFLVTSDISNIFYMTGHGLPMIIASDIVAADELFRQAEAFANNEVPLSQEEVNNALESMRGSTSVNQAVSRFDNAIRPIINNRRHTLVKAIFESGYSDVLAHTRWVDSMKYSAMNPRGGGNIWIDPSQDILHNICAGRTVIPNLSYIAGSRIRNIPYNPVPQNAPPSINMNFSETERILEVLAGGSEELANLLNNIIDSTPVLPQLYIKPQSTGTLNVHGKAPSLEYNISDDHYSYQFTAEKGDDGFPEVECEVAEESEDEYGENDSKFINGQESTENLIGGASSFGTELIMEDRTTFNGITLSLANSLANSPDNNTDHANYNLNTYELFNLKTFKEDSQLSQTWASSFDSSMSLVSSFVNSLMSRPPPDQAWVEYKSDVRVITENNNVLHKLLPKKEYSPKTVPESSNTDLRTYFDRAIPLGPDNLIGEDLDNRDYFSCPHEEDVIQYLGSPTNMVLLKGYAVRSNYPVIPPTLLRYGGKRAYQRKRDVNQSVIGSMSGPIYLCEWEITYLIRSTPTGILAIPDNPIHTQEGVNYYGTNAFKDRLEIFVPTE